MLEYEKSCLVNFIAEVDEMRKILFGGFFICVAFAAVSAEKSSPLDLLLPKPVKTESRTGMADSAACSKISVEKGAVPGKVSSKRLMSQFARKQWRCRQRTELWTQRGKEMVG